MYWNLVGKLWGKSLEYFLPPKRSGEGVAMGKRF